MSKKDTAEHTVCVCTHNLHLEEAGHTPCTDEPAHSIECVRLGRARDSG